VLSVVKEQFSALSVVSAVKEQFFELSAVSAVKKPIRDTSDLPHRRSGGGGLSWFRDRSGASMHVAHMNHARDPCLARGAMV
jgi:hypothetical protein